MIHVGLGISALFSRLGPRKTVKIRKLFNWKLDSELTDKMDKNMIKLVNLMDGPIDMMNGLMLSVLESKSIIY